MKTGKTGKTITIRASVPKPPRAIKEGEIITFKGRKTRYRARNVLTEGSITMIQIVPEKDAR